MEFQLPLSLTSLLLLAFFVTFLFKIFQRTKTQQNLPPGPPKLPIIGNLHHLAGLLPQRALRDMAKKYGDLMHLQLGEHSIIAVSSPEMAKQVLKTHDVSFANRMETLASNILFYYGSDVIFSPYGDDWRQLRKICVMELLGPKNVQSFRPIREDESWRLISLIRSKPKNQPINLTDMVFGTVTAITCRAAFGKKYGDREVLSSVLKDISLLLGGFSVVDLFPSLKFLAAITGTKSRILKVHKKLDDLLNKIIKEHEETPNQGHGDSGEEDLVDVLLRLRNNSGFSFQLTNTNIKGVLVDAFAAGIDTTASSIEWALTEMISKPETMKKAQAELREALKGKKTIQETDIQDLTYLKAVIKETLRLHSTPIFLPRECREDCELNGYKIAAKTKLLVNAWAVSRDPESWENPEEFDPERFNSINSLDFFEQATGHYIPFGSGRRSCPGVMFAYTSIALPLANLLYHFDWKLPNGMKVEDLDKSETFAINGSKDKNVCLVPIPYALSAED